MTFVLKSIPDTTLDVTVHVPGEEKPSTITATWKLHKWDQFQERVKALREGDLSDEALVEQDLITLGGIKDEKGADVPYSKDLAAELLQLGYVRRPLMASWFEAQNGRSQAAAKN